MKKILFTLLLVVGSFVAQAQNTITIGSWITNGDTFGLLVSEENQACFTDSQMTSVEETVYTWNSSTGILSIGDLDINFGGTSTATEYDSSFGSSSYLLVKLTADRATLDFSGSQPDQPIAIPAN